MQQQLVANPPDDRTAPFGVADDATRAAVIAVAAVAAAAPYAYGGYGGYGYYGCPRRVIGYTEWGRPIVRRVCY